MIRCAVEFPVIVLTIFEATSRFACHARLLFRPHARNRETYLHVPNLLCPACALLMLSLPAIPAAAITLHSDTETATAGYFQLHWEAEPAEGPFVLEESASADFSHARVLYRGPDLASVVSGKPDNEYFYRVREQASPANTSNTVKVTVAHHPLRTALGFFSVGAIVFLATLVAIFRGNSQGRKITQC